MKKILMSASAAVLAMTVSTGFRSMSVMDNLYYFSVVDDRPVGALVRPAEVLFIGFANVPTVTCPGAFYSNYICVLGVTIGKMTQINYTNLAAPVSGWTIFTRTGK